MYPNSRRTSARVATTRPHSDAVQIARPGLTPGPIIIAAMPRRPRWPPARTSSRSAFGRASAVCALVAAMAACTPPREPEPPPHATPATSAAVTRRPIQETAPTTGTGVPPESSISPGAVAPVPPRAITVPVGALYVCVSQSEGRSMQTAIEYAEKTDALCRKHPEMGPCQYERNACRRDGGRVYAADGSEITLATEAEYDRKVRRVQFKAN
jgi:hypothetical protein